MPHIILDHSDNVNLKNVKVLFENIHVYLNKSLGAKIEKCRSRIINSSNSFIGDGSPNLGYVHMDIILKNGYDPINIELLGEQILKYLKEAYVEESSLINIEFSVEIKEIGKYYFK